MRNVAVVGGGNTGGRASKSEGVDRVGRAGRRAQDVRVRAGAVVTVENADARVFFWPLSSLPMFSPVNANVNAWDIPKRAINLPSYHDIMKIDLDRVVETIVDLHKEIELFK